MDATDFPASLEACIEKFWGDNPELKREILKEWYSGGYISTTTNLGGLKAVGEWLSTEPESNGRPVVNEQLYIAPEIVQDLDNEVGELRQKLSLVEGGLELLLMAVKAGDPMHEIKWRIEEELRQLRI